MKTMLSWCLTILCLILLPGLALGLDSADQEQGLTGTPAQEGQAPHSASASSIEQRLQSYFHQISAQSIWKNLDLEADSAHQHAYNYSFPQSHPRNTFSDWKSAPSADSLDLALEDSWWLKLSYTLDLFQPLLLQGTVLRADLQRAEHKHKSWLAGLSLAYSSDLATPRIWGQYQSSQQVKTQSKRSNLPSALRDLDFTPGRNQGPLAYSSFKPSALSSSSLVQALVQQQTQGYYEPGLWEIGLGLNNINLLNRLEHSVALMYGRGTFDQDLAQENLQGLSKEDSFFEARIDQRYRLYENLAAIMELGYASLDLDPEIWGEDPQESVYLMTFGLDYEF